jgi:hypothetical protein
MNAEVVFTDDFRADLRAQTRRLIADDRPDWGDLHVRQLRPIPK